MRPKTKTWLGWLIAAAIVVGAIAGWWRFDAFRDRRALLARLSDPDPAVRQQALWELTRLKDPSLAPTFERMLAGDDNGWVREAAAYAMARTVGDTASGPIAAAIEREPPGPVVAQLVRIYARAVGSVEAAARRWGGLPGRWQTLGVLAARLHEADAAAAPPLFAAARSAELPGQRAYAAATLLAAARPMMEATGSHVDLPARPPPGGLAPAALDRFEAWWDRHVTPQLLGDVVELMQNPSDEAAEFARLLRTKRGAEELLSGE